MLTQLEQKVLASIKGYFATHGCSPTIAEITEDLGIQSRGTVHRYVQALISKGFLRREGKGWRGLVLTPAQASIAVPIHTPARVEGYVESPVERHSGAGFAPVGSTDALVDPNSDPNSNSDESRAAVAQSYSESAELPNLRIPLLGKIAAGLPIEAISNEEHLDLAGFFIGSDRYALRVTGDSMMDVGILDGDTVIVKKQSTARTGDIVVALIDAQEATLKRLGEYSGGSIELIPENSSMSNMRYAGHRVALQGVVLGQMRTY